MREDSVARIVSCVDRLLGLTHDFGRLSLILTGSEHVH